MNFGEMKEQLRIMLDDRAGDRITEEVARLFLNSALKKLWRKCIKNGKYFNIGTVEVTFTSQEMIIDDSTKELNIQKIILALDSNNIPIPIKNKVESLHSEDKSIYEVKTADTAGQPVYKVGWYVTPTGSPVVTVTYVTRITEFVKSNYSDETVINDIPEEHHDIVVLLAAILIIGKNEESVGIWGEIYNDGLEDMIDTIGLRPEGMQGVVNVEN